MLQFQGHLQQQQKKSTADIKSFLQAPTVNT